MKRKILFAVLLPGAIVLALLIFLAGFLIGRQSCKLSSVQIMMNDKALDGLQDEFETIVIRENGKDRLVITKHLVLLNMMLFSSGKPEQLVTYDVTGNKIAECFFKSGLPCSGTVLDTAWGLGGLKWSSKITFKDGKRISETPHKETELMEILKAAEKYHCQD